MTTAQAASPKVRASQVMPPKQSPVSPAPQASPKPPALPALGQVVTDRDAKEICGIVCAIVPETRTNSATFPALIFFVDAWGKILNSAADELQWSPPIPGTAAARAMAAAGAAFTGFNPATGRVGPAGDAIPRSKSGHTIKPGDFISDTGHEETGVCVSVLDAGKGPVVLYVTPDGRYLSQPMEYVKLLTAEPGSIVAKLTQAMAEVLAAPSPASSSTSESSPKFYARESADLARAMAMVEELGWIVARVADSDIAVDTLPEIDAFLGSDIRRSYFPMFHRAIESTKAAVAKLQTEVCRAAGHRAITPADEVAKMIASETEKAGEDPIIFEVHQRCMIIRC